MRQQNSSRGIGILPLMIEWCNRMGWSLVQWKFGGRKGHETSAGRATFQNKCFIIGNSVTCCAGTLHCHQLANVSPHICELFYVENPFSIRSVPGSYHWGEEGLPLCLVAAKGQWACSSFGGSVNSCFFGKLWLNHCLHFSWNEG